MSYDITLYRKEVRELHRQNRDIFENEDLLPGFSPEKKQQIHDRLEAYGYKNVSEKDGLLAFELPSDEGQSVLLSDRALYFSSTGEDLFDLMMTSSEFTDDGYLAKFDHQSGEWESMG